MKIRCALVCTMLVVAAGCGTTDIKAGVPSNEATTKTPGITGPGTKCAYTGVDEDYKNTEVDLTFVNPLGEVNALKVGYALLDGKNGTRFTSGTEKVMFPTTNERFRISTSTLSGVPPNIEEATIDCQVLSIEKDMDMDIEGFQHATEADTCKIVGSASSGDLEVAVSATSPFKKTTMKLQTWWALQAPGGVRYATDNEVTDLVTAGEPVHISSSVYPAPEWIGDGEITSAVVGFSDQEQ